MEQSACTTQNDIKPKYKKPDWLRVKLPIGETYKHVRNLKWLHVGSWSIDDSFTLKTLTELTAYPDFVEKIKDAVGFNKEKPAKQEYPLYTIDEALSGRSATRKCK